MSSESYRPVFWDPDWVLTRYHGWEVVSEGDNIKILKQRRFCMVKYLVLLAGGIPMDFQDSVRRFCSEPLSAVIVHDLSEHNPPEGREYCGYRFERLGSDARLLNVATFAVDLTQSEDSLWKKLTKSCRGMCNKASRLGAETLFWTTYANAPFGEFYAMLRELAIERSFALPKKDLLMKMFDGGNLALASCEVPSSKAKALNLIYLMAGKAVFMHGISRDQTNAGVGNLLQWETMCFLRARNICWYDMGGVPSNRPTDGIFSFKKSFGGEFVGLGAEFQRASPLLVKALGVYRMARRRLA